MVYLEDGRKELYQWDTGISVASTEACDVMEITRETYPLTRDADATLVGTMYRAEVPDELLTESGYLKIALVTVAGDSRRTNAVYRMRIKPRAKPKHVFPDHHMNATTQEILMRISALEEKIKNGTIEGAVLYTKPQALKEEEKRTARENIDAVSSKNADGTERDYVFTTDTASVGQTVVVSEIDADGKPVKYKHATPSTGGGGASGKDGATFTPDVTDGVLSWTNDGGLPNPTPVKIKGNDGKDGAPGAKGVTFTPDITDNILSWTNDGNLSNPTPVNIKGKDGGKGEKGNDGITYTPSVTNGIISWSNNGGQENPDPVDITGPKGDQGAVYVPSVTGGVLSWTNNGGLPNPDPVTIGSGGGDGSGTIEGAVLYNQEQNLTNSQKSTACDNIGALRGELDDGQAVNVVTTTDTPTVGQTVVVTGFDSDGSPTYGHADLGSGSGGTGGTPNAVQYVPQTLTEEQQTQARKNIDAQSQVYAVKRANPWSAEDCVNAPVRGLKLYGACEQKQYSGENLFNIEDEDKYTLNNCNKVENKLISNINDFYFCYIKYQRENFPINVEKGSEFTFIVKDNPGGRKISIVINAIKDDNTITTQENNVLGNQVSIKINENIKEVNYIELRFNRSDTKFKDTSTVFEKIQISNGVKTIDTYEPYVGRMPSPNLEYPQEVKYNDLTYTLKNDAEYNAGSVTAPSLYGIGDAQDEWDALTGSGTRRIEKVVIDGTTKTFSKANNDEGSYAYYYVYNTNGDATATKDALCTHLIKDINANNAGKFYCTGKTIFINASGLVTEDNASASNADALNAALTEKYTAGNPMTFYISSDDELFETTPAGQITMPKGYAQFLPSGDGVAGDIEAEYAVDIEKRYVKKETYTALEERVAALELAAIGG